MAIKKTVVPIEQAVEEYVSLKEQEKTISARKKYLSEIIKQHAEQFGVKDSSGSFYATNDIYQWGKQARKPVSLMTDEVIDFCQVNGFHDCVVLVETINEDALARHISVGDITPETIESLSKVSITYAVDVRKKEEVEVQETTLKEAYRK